MSAKRILVASIAMAVAVGCGDSTAPVARQVGLSFAGVRPAGVAPAGAALFSSNLVASLGDSLVIVDGTNTLIITKVEVVARKIELHSEGVTTCDNDNSTDDCEEFEAGARLVTLPLTPGAATAVSIAVPAGTYTSIELNVHKIGTGSSDSAFRAANPAWPTSTSIRVTGFYNGTPFTYTTDVDFEAEESIQPPLVIAATSVANLTVRIDPSIWFRTGATGPLINPATAGVGGANKSLVDNNIQNSVKAFEDDDHNGDERDH